MDKVAEYVEAKILMYKTLRKGDAEVILVPPRPVPIGIIEKRTGYSPLCDHSWKLYEGISKRFEYCEKCDEKR